MREESEMAIENGAKMPEGFGDDDDSEDGDIFARRGANDNDAADSDGDEMFRPDEGNDVFGQSSEHENDNNFDSRQSSRRKETLVF